MDEDRRTVSTDGITVEKRVDTDQFKTPAVILEIASAADRSTTVTVTEPIPEAFAVEDVGFHPEFGGEHWSIAGRNIEFERAIDPGEEYTTVYGVRDVAPEEIGTFLGAETSVATGGAEAEAASAPGGETDAEPGGETDAEPGEELLAEDDGEAVRDVIAGEDDSLSGATADEPAPEAAGDAEPESGTEETIEADGEDAEETPEAGGEDAEETTDEETTEAGGEDGGDEPEAGDADVEAGAAAEYRTLPGSVAEALAAEIRDGTIAAENERVLREAFADPETASGSVTARIEHLQTQVADLAAYTDELERFLDEHGGGDSALTAVEENVADLTGTVGALEDDLDAVAESTDELGVDLADLETEVDEARGDLESELDEVRGDVDALDDRLEEVDALNDRLEAAETGIDDLLYLEEDVMELQDRTEDLPDLEESIEELRAERVEDLDARLDGLEDTIDTLESEMEEMKAFRDRLSSAFGPGGGPEE